MLHPSIKRKQGSQALNISKALTLPHYSRLESIKSAFKHDYKPNLKSYSRIETRPGITKGNKYYHNYSVPIEAEQSYMTLETNAIFPTHG
jgi:hypothetical protein